MMAMKEPLRSQTGYVSFREAVMFGKLTTLNELVVWLFRIGDALQELGPLKIEYVRSVDPNFAYKEDELIGVD